MKHNEEIALIREMINKQNTSENGNYPSSTYDDELTDGVTFLEKKDTGLSLDIIVDCGESYKIYNHNLCLFMVINENVIPVLISNQPDVVGDKNSLPNDIRKFIIDNLQLLTSFANMQIDGGDFFEGIEKYKNSKNLGHRMVVEMSNYGPDKTGLPIWVYIDDTGSYKRSGHSGSYRMKFQQDKNISNPRMWLPITIPDLNLMPNNVPTCKEPQKNVNLVIQWAKGNLDLLLKLKDGVISGADFKKQMKTMDEIQVIIDSEC